MKGKIFSLMFAAIGMLTATYGWAAPSVNSVDGTFSQGQSINISGSGFGAKASAAPVLWDTVDNIPSYSGLSNGSTIPVGGSNPWDLNSYGGGNYVKYDTSDPQRGAGTAQYKASNTKSGYLDGLSWPATNYAYVSWWWKTDTNVGGNNHSSKFLRMSDSSDLVNKTFSWTQMQNYVYSSPNYLANNWNSFDGNPNKWNFFEVFFDNSKCMYTIRVNGRILTQSSWTPTSSPKFNELWKIGFDGGGVSPPSITWWMDDIYVDNTFARVMLGDASTYDASTHFEMQPISSWSTGSITSKFNKGSFSNGTTAYIYVVDASGAVNSSGYPITIGGGSGTPTPTPPPVLVDNPPSIGITSPSTTSTFTSPGAQVNISGSASDDDGISSISWTSSDGRSGSTTDSSTDWSSWSIANLNLQPGDNLITVTATDTSGQTASATITITYTQTSGTQDSQTSGTQAPAPPTGLHIVN